MSARFRLPDHFSLEPLRQVVQHGEDNDDDDGQSGPLHAPPTRLERSTDGHVPVAGYQQHDPDGRRLRGGRQRPDVALDHRKRASQHAVQFVCDLQRLNDDACGQVDRVDGGEGLQQPRRRVGLVRVEPQNRHRQSVTCISINMTPPSER